MMDVANEVAHAGFKGHMTDQLYSSYYYMCRANQETIFVCALQFRGYFRLYAFLSRI